MTARRPSAVNAIWFAWPAETSSGSSSPVLSGKLAPICVDLKEGAEPQFANDVAKGLHPDLPCDRTAGDAQ